ncbi:MAG: hypothetical protein WA914_01355, partial [Candidatus Macondimonas sp.]
MAIVPTTIRTQYRHPGMGRNRMHGALLGMGALQLIFISKSKEVHSQARAACSQTRRLGVVPFAHADLPHHRPHRP